MTEQIFDLRIRELEVQSARGRALLRVPRLEIPAGQTLGIQGPSGAGKSTLIYALAGLAARAGGEVLWGSDDILGFSDAKAATFRSRHIGMIFQDFLLFEELAPLPNAALQTLFAPKAQRRRIADAAKQHLDALGIGQEPRNVASCSGGERQRIAMARALAHDPMIVLADEPTANLDRASGDALTDALLQHVTDRGCTLVVVSHDERLLGRMDRVVTIAEGALVGGARAA